MRLRELLSMSVYISVGLNLKSWINLNTFDDEGVSWGYETPIISVKTNVDIIKDLIKMPIFGKDGNWSSTLINNTILQIYRQ